MNNDDYGQQQSYLEWPRLSSPSFSSSRPAPRWTTILGPCQVLLFPNFLLPHDTQSLVDYLQHEMKIQIDDKLDPTKPRPVNVPRPGYAFRDNDRIQFDSPEFAAMIWNKCGLRDRNNKRIRHAVGLSRNIRMYRYQQGQSFGAHYDESVDEKDDEGNDVVSEYTVLIYLNGERDSDLLGGETVFYPKGVAVKPERGLLLVHKHGDECMLHEALIVQRGFKYVLRTDVVYEP
ncbi:MAG: hypothetical protein J3R72DRAFT_367921 [Linnemannia gamsii]|nr:MAG: hypothetical protein J3R72DRAFT_367921 [Linnemannia gamsii]